MSRCPVCGQDPGSQWFCRSCGAPLADAALALPAKRQPRGWGRRLTRITLAGIAAALVLCTLLIVVAALQFNWTAFAIASVTAVLPALGYSWLVLRLDPYEKEPIRTLIAAFGWGAVAAILLALILEILTGSLLIFTVGEEAANVLTAVIAAPVIEETTKGIALLLLLWFFRDEFDNLLDGLVYGALIGLGFAMTENILYFGVEYLNEGTRGLGELFVVRVIMDGFGHASYTAITGAAVGWSRSRYSRGIGRIIVPVLGWSLAVFLHFLWNASLVFIAGMAGEDVSLWKVVLIQAPLFTFAPVVVLIVIARTSGRRELEIMRQQLAPEVAYGVITPDEYETMTTKALRKRAIQDATVQGGRPLRNLQDRFFQVAANLAFRKYHLSRGERPKPHQRAPEDAYRAELANLRSELLAALTASPLS